MSIVDGLTRPDFIVIGAMKSGTTTLYRMLSAHPQIGMSRDKEPDYFVQEKNLPRGPVWYAGQFKPGFKMYGEASPNYTKADDFGGVAARIRAQCPGVKLIYIVRDPVDRFVSQYKHSWTIGDLATTPEDLLGTSEYRHILSVSSYARQMDEYLIHFERRDVLILDFEGLRTDPQMTFDEVLDFTGAEPHRLTDFDTHNNNAEISRIPSSLLRFAQSPLGRSVTKVVGRGNRDRLRRLLARGKQRNPPVFPESLLDHVRDELRGDTERFRRLTGMSFPEWSL